MEGATVTYVHRGAPNDLMTVKGEDITELGRSFFRVGEGMVPYHRIVRIERGGELLFSV